MSEPVLQVKGLKTYYYTEEGVVPAVDGLDFEVEPGETFAIVGESGCGKSVTSLSILRLIPSPPGKIIDGEIIYHGQDLVKKSEREMRSIRGNDISMIFQEPMTSLNPVFTVGQQIGESFRFHQQMGKAEMLKKSIEMLRLVGIPEPEHVINDYPNQLSGGMRQRVMIASHFQPTILLAIYSQLITILIAIPCGMLAAKKRGTIADYFVSVLSMLGISLPSFLMGLGMVLLFAVNLRVLPAAGYKNPFTDGFLPFLRYMTLPAVSLGFIHAGYMMRMTKASMLEVLGSDYIKMARSKGVREWKIVTKHTFRNALLTVITVVGQGFISALAGAAVVERLFNIPGMGSLMVDSIEKRDYQVIQAITLLIAMLNVFINLIIDLIYGLADPRIRLD